MISVCFSVSLLFCSQAYADENCISFEVENVYTKQDPSCEILAEKKFSRLSKEISKLNFVADFDGYNEFNPNCFRIAKRDAVITKDGKTYGGYITGYAGLTTSDSFDTMSTVDADNFTATSMFTATSFIYLVWRTDNEEQKWILVGTSDVGTMQVDLSTGVPTPFDVSEMMTIVPLRTNTDQYYKIGKAYLTGNVFVSNGGSELTGAICEK